MCGFCEECTEREIKIKLNLGCGRLGQLKGYLNVDAYKNKGVDIIHNLNKIPYPFDDNSIDEIYISHVLEHLDLSFEDFIKEMRRILKRNGILLLRVPIGVQALSLFHKKYFSIGNFMNRDISCLQQLDAWKGFKIESVKLGFIKGGYTWFFNIFIERLMNKVRLDIYEHSFLRYLFPADELIINIIKENNIKEVTENV